MSAMVSLRLASPLFWACSWNTTEAWTLSLVWLNLSLCDQQTWGYVPKIIWCWSELMVPSAQWLREVTCKGGGGRWVRVRDEASFNQQERKEKSHIKEMKFLWSYNLFVWYFLIITLNLRIFGKNTRVMVLCPSLTSYKETLDDNMSYNWWC